MAQLRRKQDAFSRLGGRVVLVGLGSVAATAEFKSRFDVPFAMIADPDKRLFQAFDLSQARVSSLFSPTMMARGLKAMAGGHGIGRPKGDVRQLPGVFIIDAAGQIQFAHHAKGPADHPDPEMLLERLAALKR